MMKKIFNLCLLIGSILCSVGCSNNANVSDRYSKDYSKYDYSIYYELDTLKGLEIYSWKNELGVYECGLMSGTNRIKFVDEITTLQKNHPCPLDTMSTILDTYSEENQNNAYLTIVSNPVQETDLSHGSLEDYLNDDLSYLKYHLGIEDISKEEYDKKNLKTEWRENYLLTKDRRELFILL